MTRLDQLSHRAGHIYLGQMAYSAPHLGELVYDWDIPGDEVALLQPDSETEYIPKGLAIDIAHAQGKHLVPEFQSDAEPVFCNIATLALPPRWERGPDRDPDAELDDELWFIGLCGKRDLLTGNPHTSGGRMSAWCPTERAGYNVSQTRATKTLRTTTPGAPQCSASAAPGTGLGGGAPATSADAGLRT